MISDYYHDIDLHANQLFNSRLHNITTAARIILGGTLSTSDKGYMVYDTDLSSPYFWNGTQWLAAGGGGTTWGSITGTLTAQTDLTAYLTANYYPLSSNPAGYLTSSALTPYLTSATAASTYEPIISAGTTSQYWRGDKTWQTFPTIPTVGTWGGLNYPTWTSGTPFVKMTAVGTFALDTTIYQPLLTNPVTGTGTINVLPKWSATGSTLHDSIVQQVNTNNIQIGGSSVAGTILDLFSSSRVDFRMYPYSTTTDYFGIYSYGPTGYGSSYTQIGLNDGIDSTKQGGAIYLDTRASLPPVRLTVKGSGSNVMIDALSVATSGNVGIGTTTPAYKLDVYGTTRIKASTTGNVFRITNSTDDDLVTVDADGSTVIGRNGITTTPLTIVGNSGVQATIGNSNFASPQSIYRYGGGKLDFYGYNNDGIGFDYKFNNSQQSTSVTSAMINLGGIYNNQQSFQFANLLISPTYNFDANTNTNAVARGILYNPTITDLRTATHIAFQNVSGDNAFNSSSGKTAFFGQDIEIAKNPIGYTGYSRIYPGPPLFIGGLTNHSDTVKPYLTLGVLGGNNMAANTVLIRNLLGDVSQSAAGTYTNTQISGRILSLSGSPEHRFLDIRPSYDDNGNPNTYTGTIRGVYYNLTKSTPFPAGASNIAWENVNGDIIHGNLATGGADEMVTVDTSGKLKKQTIPSGSTSPLTTKGDLYTFSTLDARLPIGLDTQILLADSTTATGLKWGTNTAATPLGYYGAFSDVTDQFATVINTGYPMLLGVTDLSNGVTVVSGSRVTIANTGIYNIQWSGQFTNPTAAEHDVTIWLRKNGVDVPGSAGVVLVPKKHGSFDGHTLPSWNFLLDVIAGDYYEFVWSTQDTAVFISFEPAGSPPPSTASVVLTVTQQSGIMAGTGISRGIYSVSTNTTAGNGANVDYVYLVSGTTTITLPTAVGNTNRYTIKRSGTGVVSIATTSSQTIDGSASPININVQYVSIDLISNGTNWEII